MRFLLLPASRRAGLPIAVENCLKKKYAIIALPSGDAAPAGPGLAYAAQMYAAALGILLMPAYLSHLGAEAFALMMIFSLVQTVLQLADLGFPAALSRQFSLALASPSPKTDAQRLLHGLEKPMVVSALVLWTLVGMAAIAYLHGTRSLVRTIANDDYVIVLSVAAPALIVRWASELYRSALLGAGRFVVLAAITAAAGTFRSIITLEIMRSTVGGLSTWLVCQLVISLGELIVLRVVTSAPRADRAAAEPIASVKALWPLARQITLASMGWIFITQMDKLVLSQALSLSEYGKVAIAATISGSLIMLAIPIIQINLPKLVWLYGSGDSVACSDHYLRTTLLICVLLFPAAFTAMVFPCELLGAWFAKPMEGVAGNMRWYSIGASFLVLSALPYALLNASGNLRGHLVATGLLALGLSVLLLIGSRWSGSHGAILCWALGNMVYFFLWPGIVHRKLLHGHLKRWLMLIGRSAASVALLALLIRYAVDESRIELSPRVLVVAVWCALQLCAVSVTFRRWI